MRSADLTARARIRDAAITCFARSGVAATTVREIAAAAEVSPGLVIHHYGSKDGLREECDAYVVDLIMSDNRDVVQGRALDPLAPIRSRVEGPPLLRYVARALVDDSPQVAGLVDRVVADAEAVSTEAVAGGIMHASDDERARAVVITLWSLGALVLHDHLRRLLGEDLLGDLEHARRYVATATEVLSRPTLTDQTYQRTRAALRQMEE